MKKKIVLILASVLLFILLGSCGWYLIGSECGARPLFYLSDSLVSSVERTTGIASESSYYFEYYKTDGVLSVEEEARLLSFLRTLEPGDPMDPDPIFEHNLMNSARPYFLIHTPLRQIPVGYGLTTDPEGETCVFILLGKRFYRASGSDDAVIAEIAELWGRDQS